MTQLRTYHAADYMPHRPPMVMVDTVCIGDSQRYILTTIRPDNLFLREDGILERAVFPELAAQSAAALDGILRDGNIRPGMLAVAKNVTYGKDVKAGDTLKVEATDETPMDDWRIIYFTITRVSDGEICAQGQLNLCLL